MEFNFNDKVVLITGASAGIGEATALLFAKYKAKLSLVGRDEASLKDVAKRCESEGSETLVIVADLGTEEGCNKTAKDTIDHFSRLDVLVNNAGVGGRACITRLGSLELFDKVFDVNARGVYYLTSLLVPELMKTKGNIVNVSSISGMMMMPSVGSLPYSMSKAALDQFTRCVALELAPQGIRVNTVNPGITVSKFVKRLTNYTDAEYKAWLNEAKNHIPMGRVCESGHIAKSIMFLASEHADLITGTTVVVDGGLSLAGSGNSSDMMKRQIK